MYYIYIICIFTHIHVQPRYVNIILITCMLHDNLLPKSSNCNDHNYHSRLLFSRDQALEQQLFNASDLDGDRHIRPHACRQHALGLPGQADGGDRQGERQRGVV